ncbi:hypothetical protein CDAR_231311 [Caerostris darwini]|uniref:Uncharacterized protein n=1 Tax=Caerostris darwini TaxID=1538125 RepID=A0AAV4WR18_9ARAC|nr:hypothetical protein CDAR_231311 [Caerostris darwini]
MMTPQKSLSYKHTQTQKPTLSSPPSLLCRISLSSVGEQFIFFPESGKPQRGKSGSTNNVSPGKDGGNREIDFDLLFKDQGSVRSLCGMRTGFIGEDLDSGLLGG